MPSLLTQLGLEPSAPHALYPRSVMDPEDLGLTDIPSTDILYRNMAFLNLVDPISYDLLGPGPAVPQDGHCLQPVGPAWAIPTCSLLTASRAASRRLLAGEAGSLSGVPLSARGVQHITRFLGGQGRARGAGPELRRAERELLRLLLPGLWTPPRLSQLLLNGAAAWEPTEAVKDTAKFTALARVDLGNNVDVASLPQPLLVGLCRRLSQHTSPRPSSRAWASSLRAR
uniref:Leucine rich repeat containing 75B n=1 Tax=Molossus molossus TaxID=27622 RepID=A0A7J8BYM8_MOLMO|nr:leucine rich repeat containing 75B [Molossus molossus]